MCQFCIPVQAKNEVSKLFLRHRVTLGWFCDLLANSVQKVSVFLVSVALRVEGWLEVAHQQQQL